MNELTEICRGEILERDFLGEPIVGDYAYVPREESEKIYSEEFKEVFRRFGRTMYALVKRVGNK